MLRPALAFALLTSCKGGCDDKPFVPYHIGDDAAAPLPGVGGTAASRGPDAGALPLGSAKDAPPGTTHWVEAGLTLDAPPGTTFQRGLFRDFDGDGKDDALVIAKRDNVQDAAVVFYASAAGAAPPGAIVVPQARLVGDATCSLVSRL